MSDGFDYYRIEFFFDAMKTSEKWGVEKGIEKGLENLSDKQKTLWQNRC